MKPKKIDNLLEMVRQLIGLGRYRETAHALQRQTERDITLPIIIHVLNTGRHEKSKDSFDEAYSAWNYSVRGMTIDGRELRVIVSFDVDSGLLIITAFYLEKRS